MAINEYDAILQGEAPKANPYDAIVTDQVQHSQLALRGSMAASAQTAPDQAAKIIQLSDRLKLPRQVVERNFDTLSKKYDLSDNDYNTIISENPALSSWLSDPENASVARDDVPVLQRIENTFYSFGRGWARASKQTDLADLLYKEVESGLSPQEAARRDALKLEQERFTNADKRNGVPEYVAGVTGYSARQMGSSLFATAQGAGMGGALGAAAGAPIAGVGAAPGFVAGVAAGGLTASANYSYRMETGFAFDELRALKDLNGNALDPNIARNAARAVGTINAMVEMGSTALLATLVPGFNKVVGGLSGDQAKRAVLNEVKDALASPTRRKLLLGALGKMGSAGSVEGIEEFVQSLVGAGGREVAQAASGQTFAPDSVSEDIAKASREAMDAAIGTFFTFTPVGGAHYFTQARQAAKAQQQEHFFTALGTGITDSKTFERMPEKMRAFIEQATKDGPIDTVFMPIEPWVAYWQSKGLDPANVAGEVLGGTEAYETALATGADLSIPMSRYATRLAPTEHNSFLAQELRLAPDEMNAREAGEFEKRMASEQDKAKQQEKAGVMDEGVTRVVDDVKQKLVAAGVEDATASAYAQTYGAAFRSIGERAGVDPAALFERYGLQITRQDAPQPGETEMAQTSTPTNDDARAWADEVKQRLGLQEFSVWVSNIGDLNLNGIEVAKDSRKQGKGTAALKELTAYADKHGLRITLTPAQRDDKHGTTSRGRLVKFYRQFGFVPNKGRHKDFTISDGMYREPQGPRTRALYQDTIDGTTGEIIPQPPFFSMLERQIGTAKLDRAPAEQWKKYIEGLAQKGVKKEEIMMSGVLDWLDIQTQRSQGGGFVLLTKSGEYVQQGQLEDKTRWEDGEKVKRGDMVVRAADSRVTRDDILNYLAASGVKVEEKILGEPKDAVLAPMRVEPIDPDAEIAELRLGSMRVGPFNGFDYSRRASVNDVENHRAALAEQLLIDQEDLRQAGGDIQPYVLGELDRRIADMVQSGERPTYIDGARQLRAELAQPGAVSIQWDVLPEDSDEPSDEEVADKARELWQEQLFEEAENYARESDYLDYDIVVRVPNVRIVRLPSDMLRGGDQWGIQEITYNLSDDPNHEKADTYWYQEKVDISDVDELGEPRFVQWMQESGTHGGAKSEQSPMTFAHEVDAIVHIKNNDGIYYMGDPYISAMFNEDDQDIGDYDNKNDAEAAAEADKSARFDTEVESYMESASVDDHGDYFYNKAREELQAEREGGGNRSRSSREERNVPATRHPRQWQSKGGRNYRELVLSVPTIEPYNASDSTHFGTDTGGKTVAWTRFKIHNDNKGTPTLFIEEVQSQRAQHGREQGFTDDNLDENNQQKFVDLTDEIERIRGNVDATLERHGFSSVAEVTIHVRDGNEDARRLYDDAIRPATERMESLEDERRAIQETHPKVPPAPFVKDTQAWVALTMKRVVRYAADNGVSQIAWTQGVQNVERYGTALREQVRNLDWKVNGNKFDVHVVTRHSGNKDVTWADSELKSALGPDMASQIAEAVSAGRTSGTIEGDDIRIDDLGMAHFYGDESGINPKGQKSIMSIVAEKIIKGLGGKSGVKRIEVSVDEGGRKYDGAPGFELTPEMADKAKGGFSMFQQSEDAKRGRIRFQPERKFSIDLLQNADLSTFIHESGHFWLEVLADMATELRVAPADKLNAKQLLMRDDYDTLLKWLGVTDRSQVGEQQHEKFARAIESYFMEGKAPSADLRSIFARVRAWMLSIYKSITDLHVSVTPEVREVFDRMFATDEQIAQAQGEAAVEALFIKPEDAGMTPVEFAAYSAKVEKASAAAKEGLQAKLMHTLQREREAWWKAERRRTRAEIAKDVHKRRDVIAYHVLVKDAMPDGEALPYDLQRVKMNRAAIDAMYGEGSWKNLPRGSTASDGISLQAVADLLGYQSPDELVKALRQAEPADTIIERETDERMKAEHGDMLVDGTIVDAARLAVQNDERAAVVMAELKALAKLRREAKPAVDAEKQQQRAKRDEGLDALDRLIPTLSAIRSAARRAVASKLVRELKPMSYLIAARRASQSAVEAAGAQNFTTAIAAKQRELFNIELYRAAQSTIDEVDATVDYMHKFGEAKVRGRIAKAGQDYLDQIDGFLDRYEFARVPLKSLDRRKALAAWVAEKEKAGEPVDLSDDVVVERRINFKDMTVEELRGVRDSVKHIEHLAKLKNRLLTSKAKKELNDAAADIAESIEKNAKAVRPKDIETRLPTKESKRLIESWLGLHRKLASWARQLDGFGDAGQFWEYIIRPMNEAGNNEADMNAAAMKNLKKLFDAYKGADMRALFAKQQIESIGMPLTKMARLMVALNWGNDDSRQKIMDGYGWGQAQVGAILETLDERDWKFVQGVWDFINGYWPEIAAKEKRVNGVAPEKVEASMVKTKFGEFAGGYFPMKYDDRQSPRAFGDRVKEMAEMMMRSGYGRSSTRRGHTKERTEGVKRPVRLDFGVIDEHISAVIHDLTHHEMLLDVNRLLGHKSVQTAILDHYGDVVYKQMQQAVADIAAGNTPAIGAFEKSLNWLRGGATIAGLAWNVMTSIVQPAGLAQSMVRIGPKYVMRGVGKWLSDDESVQGTVDEMLARSKFMRNRMNTQLREINEIRNEVGLNTGKFAGWVDQAMRAVTLDNVNKQAVVDSYFYLIHKAQQIADIPTWLGAHEKAIDEGKDDETAVALADQAVLDSQGGGQMKDLAGIQRGGPLLKLWTNFYSYFNVTYNLSVESVRRTKFSNPGHLGRLAVDFLLLYTLPATFSALLRSLVKGDDEDEMLKRLITENITYLFGIMVGVRELAAGISGLGGYEGPAGTRFFSSIAKLVKQTGQGEADSAFWHALNDAAGILLHYPAGQVRRTVDGYIALRDGDTRNPLSLLVGPPKP